MKILIVDDSIEKISELSKFIFSILPEAEIVTTQDVFNTITLLKTGEIFNLAIIDLLLPLRNSEDPKNNGGKILVDEIYRISSITPPNYIVGFTQLDIDSIEFSKIWSTIRFNYGSLEWKTSINQLISHINSSKHVTEIISIILPQIFVEGLTDKSYIEATIKCFFNEIDQNVKIISQKNAGANWVATQISLWAMKLQKGSDSQYIKSIGLLDSDEAGNIAKKKVDQRNLSDNEKQCCSYFQLKPNYNDRILDFYKKGCKIEIEIESLFPNDILEYAETKGWLEYRPLTFIDPPADWKQHEETSLQFISKQEIPKESLIYLKKVKIEHKMDFCNYVLGLEKPEYVFANFKELAGDILKKINLIR